MLHTAGCTEVHSAGMDPAAIAAAVFEEMDLDGSKALDEEEFVAFCMKTCDLKTLQQLAEQGEALAIDAARSAEAVTRGDELAAQLERLKFQAEVGRTALE